MVVGSGRTAQVPKSFCAATIRWALSRRRSARLFQVGLEGLMSLEQAAHRAHVHAQDRGAPVRHVTKGLLEPEQVGVVSKQRARAPRSRADGALRPALDIRPTRPPSTPKIPCSSGSSPPIKTAPAGTSRTRNSIATPRR